VAIQFDSIPSTRSHCKLLAEPANGASAANARRALQLEEILIPTPPFRCESMARTRCSRVASSQLSDYRPHYSFGDQRRDVVGVDRGGLGRNPGERQWKPARVAHSSGVASCHTQNDAPSAPAR
jgi:hypothetical protein